MSNIYSRAATNVKKRKANLAPGAVQPAVGNIANASGTAAKSQAPGADLPVVGVTNKSGKMVKSQAPGADLPAGGKANGQPKEPDVDEAVRAQERENLALIEKRRAAARKASRSSANSGLSSALMGKRV